MYLDDFGLYPDGACDCFGSMIDLCGICTSDPCEVSAFFPPLINNDYKDYIEVSIYLNGYANNSIGLEGMEFQFSYNNEYYNLDDEDGINLNNDLIGYVLDYNDYVLNDTLNQVDVIIYASNKPITNFDSSDDIINLYFTLNNQDGDYSYLHNKITQLTFVDEFKIGNNIITASNGEVEFKTMMCLDSSASNFCHNEDSEVPSIPQNECLYYNNQEEYR